MEERQKSLLDNLDKKLRTMLQDNGRTSEISGKIKYRKNTIWYRIERLKRRVIREFTAFSNTRMVRQPIAATMVITTEPNQLNEVCESLVKLEETRCIRRDTGEYDLIVIAHYEDMEAIDLASQEIKSMHRVRGAENHLVTCMRKTETNFDDCKI